MATDLQITRLTIQKMKEALENPVGWVNSSTFNSSETLGSYEDTFSPDLKFNDTAKFANTKTADDEFYKQVVEGVGATWNNETKIMMYAWRQAEGGSAANNPFNTTLSMGETNEGCFANCLSNGRGAKPTGCRTCPPGYSPGVRNYKTPEIGLKATLQTLQSKKYTSYSKIVEALKNNDINSFIEAVGAGQWGTNKSLLRQVIKSYVNGNDPKPKPIYAYKV